MADATMAEVWRYFADGDTKSFPLGKFREEWAELTDTDKAQLRAGVGNGTLTY